MREIKVKNINYALSEALWWLRISGLREDSRNGPVLVAPGPVLTEYRHPEERVIFCPIRDANPVFHLMEALWMLAGESDIRFLLPFNSRFGEYAQNNIQWGAYGRRWRSYFGRDQIVDTIKMLERDPNSRRAVIAMWDPIMDGRHEGPDIPCNTHIYFDLRGGVLNMTVCCRSNDVLWGAYGANAVHFSVLQEVIATELRVDMGVYRQFSNNFHLYTALPVVQKMLDSVPDIVDPYAKGQVFAQPILGGSNLQTLTEDCQALVRGETKMRTPFMAGVAVPLRDAYLARKRGEAYALTITENDWITAYTQWCERREHREVSASDVS